MKPTRLWRFAGPLSLPVAVSLLVFSCAEEVVEEEFEPRESHGNYREALTELELADSEMGARWIESARRALEAPAELEPPASEVIYFDPAEPEAVGYRFPTTRGRRVEIEIEAEHERYFADVFRLPRDEDEEAEHVASRPEGGSGVEFEARSNDYYVLRVQPELLRGGRFEISIRTGASLAFPVEGTGPGDIMSFFGSGRDGGSREHHGVDIFAPRGTPVLAASESTVTRVGERDRGGNVIVLRDEERGISLYYAHLEEQLTEEGREVVPGETIGTVGNTGNARATPPHLHIGIYQGGWRRPVDPWPYFVGPPATDPPPIAHEERLGEWRAAGDDLLAAGSLPGVAAAEPEHRNRNPYLRGAGDTFAGAETDLADDPPPEPPRRSHVIEPEAPVRIVGAAGDLLRIRTVAGGEGFVEPETLSEDQAAVELEEPALLRDPRTGDAFGELGAGEQVTVVAETDRGRLALLPSGRAALLDPMPRSEEG